MGVAGKTDLSTTHIFPLRTKADKLVSGKLRTVINMHDSRVYFSVQSESMHTVRGSYKGSHAATYSLNSPCSANAMATMMTRRCNLHESDSIVSLNLIHDDVILSHARILMKYDVMPENRALVLWSNTTCKHDGH